MRYCRTRKLHTRIPALACCLLMVFMCAAPVVYAASDADRENTEADTGSRNSRVVRVGWYQSDMFQEGMDGEMKSGYCYDYLQKVSDYTSWEYEYVYGNWTELFHMLEKGEIDCLGGVSMTKERRDKMLFPETAMGTDQYYLFKENSDNSLLPSELDTFNGKRVGVIKDNQVTAFTRSWAEEKNINLELVYFDSFEEQEKAFKEGRIDLMAQTINNVLTIEKIDIAAKIGEDPFYLAVSSKSPDILSELNEALSTILSIDPFMMQDLQYSNYGATLISKTLTDEELVWVSSHPEITVAYLNNYLPYSDTDSKGRPTGLMTDTLDAILTSLGLDEQITLKYVPYEDFGEMADALREGEVDMAFPVYGNLWELEQKRIDASSPVVQGSESFVFKGSYDKSKVHTISVNKNNAMQIAYCKKHFPDAQMLDCGSIDECLDAVLKGRADGTIINTLRTELVTSSSKYENLTFIQLQGDDSRCFGTGENNTELLLILNRGLRIIGTSFGIEHSYKYMEGFYTYAFRDLLMNNLHIVLPIAIVIVGCIILLLIISLRRQLAQVRQQEEHIQQVNALNEELEDLSRKADAANAAKTSFLFNMSHDIRTPMNAILGFSSLMEKNIDRPELLKDELSKIQSSGEYLLTLINNMLEVARIDSGKEKLREEFMDLHDDKYSAIPIFDEEIRRKNLKVTKEIDVQHRYIFADSHKITEIMLNLLSNAIKYTPEGGSVHILIKEIPCDKEGYASYSYILTDTGIGMSQEFQEVIFESFARERNTTESQIAGSGLGMSIVKRLVDLMDGTIEVESEQGKGSTFTVTAAFRIVDNPEEYLMKMKLDVPVEKPDLTGRRLLLAEDNEINAEIAIEILEDFGAQVEHARDGAECVEMLSSSTEGYYDLILMDIQMPNMNGYEATRQIRELADLRKASIPIVAMTANAFDEDKCNAIEAGMNAHLTKPIEITKLTETLSEFLN